MRLRKIREREEPRHGNLRHHDPEEEARKGGVRQVQENSEDQEGVQDIPYEQEGDMPNLPQEL